MLMTTVCFCASTSVSSDVSSPTLLSSFCSASNLTWIVDFAASSHMNFGRSAFCSYEELPPSTTKVGNKAAITVLRQDDIEFSLMPSKILRDTLIENNLYVPHLGYSLSLVSALVGKGFGVSLTSSGTGIVLKNSFVAVAALKNEVYYINNKVLSNTALVTNEVWDERFGHIGYRPVSAMSYDTV